MTPDQLAKSGTEHGEQRAFFAWLRANNPQVWEVTFAIPNGGSRGEDERTRAIRGSTLKAEGVKAGVPDIMVAWPQFAYGTRIMYSGLFIEMKRSAKRGSKGRVAADTQSPWHTKLTDRGYKVVVAYTWREAAGHVLAYFGVALDRQPALIEAWPAQGSL